MLNWFFIRPIHHTINLTCFDSLFQQPFVFVRNARSTPIFDRRFVDKRFNRVQYIEHLRLLGYQFRLLAHPFGLILPEST